MGLFRNLINGVEALIHKERRGQEVEEELRSYMEADVKEKMRRGMNREDALRAARIDIGSGEGVRHKVWSAGWESTAESLWQDVRYGVRQLLKSPGFSIVAILSLALGIGANTAIFTLINDLLLKSLPVRDPQHLVAFGEQAGAGVIDGIGPGKLELFPYDFYKQIE